MILFDILMYFVERIGDACGNLFTMGSSDGLIPQRPLWVEILEIITIGALVIAGVYLGFFF